MVIEVNVAEMGGHDGDNATLTYTTTVKKHNQPLDAAAFAFDTTNLKQAKSIQEWANPGAAAKEGNADAPVSPMVGKPAPAVELTTLEGKPFKLSDVKEKVVVLDFWATWCPPCRRGLPVIQKVAEWAAAEKLSVAVYTVNLRETADEVKKFLADNKLTLAVLMDVEGGVGQAYDCNTIPRTVVILDGKVVKVHEGFSPTMEEELKKEITEALAPAK
ncbi:MAG: TlpA family protein disulfide reductase [Planctomycetes bacterium]|nr:TlpA family protein disulfide reductase [Planctomycetota bacterium]